MERMELSSTTENRRGSIESMVKKSVTKFDEEDSTQAFINSGSFEERLWQMVRNYKRLYDVSYEGHRDK